MSRFGFTQWSWYEWVLWLAGAAITVGLFVGLPYAFDWIMRR